MDPSIAHRLFSLRERIAAHFQATHWEELGLLTGQSEAIDNHPRLLRSLSWNDPDYGGNVLSVLRTMVAHAGP